MIRQSRMDGDNAVLRRKILNSFQCRDEQSVDEIHRFCKGEIAKLGEVLKQLEDEAELVCVRQLPRQYRSTKISFSKV